MMDENNKRIAKNTLMLYFRMLLIMAVTLYTSRVVLEVLGIEDFGIYNVVGGIVVMLGFLNSAMSSATQRFLSFELGRNDYEQLKKVFSTAVTIHYFAAVVIFILAETLGLWFLNTQLTIPIERINAANYVYQFSIFTFMISVTSVPYNAVIISHERMNVYAYVSIIEVALKLVIVFVLKNFGFDKLSLYAVFVFVVSFLIRCVYQIYCQRKFKECVYHFVWDKKMSLQMMSFSGWSMFGGAAYMAKSQGLNLLLNLLFGPLANAAWGISNQVNTALLSFTQNFAIAMNPPIVKAYASKDLIKTVFLLFSGMKYSFLLSFILITPVLFEIEYLFSIWLVTVPKYAIIYTKLMLVNTLIESFAPAIWATVQATGTIRWYQLIVGSFLLLNLPIAFLAIQITANSVSVFVVAVVLTLISFVFRYVILYKLVLFSVKELLRLGMTVFTLFVLVYPVLYIIVYFIEGGLMRFLFIAFLSTILSLIVYYIFGMTINEKKVVNNKFIVLFSLLLKIKKI